MNGHIWHRKWGRLPGLASLALVMAACGASASSPSAPSPNAPAPTSPASASPSNTSTDVSPAAAAPSAEPAASKIPATTVQSPQAPAGAIRVDIAGPPPHYVPDHLTAQAGKVMLFLVNGSHATHTLAIGPPSALLSPEPQVGNYIVVSDSVAVGQSVVFTVSRLDPGTYAIWCTIGAHAAEGMVGTLVVQ